MFDNGLKLANDTVVAVWKYHNTGSAAAAAEAAVGAAGAARTAADRSASPPTWQQELFNVTQAGFRAVVSSPWYLNYISYGVDWPEYLTADLLDFNGTAAQQALVMGGEFAMVRCVCVRACVRACGRACVQVCTCAELPFGLADCKGALIRKAAAEREEKRTRAGGGGGGGG